MPIERKSFDYDDAKENRKNPLGLKAVEVEFVIRVDNPEFNFLRYQDRISDALLKKNDYKRYDDDSRYYGLLEHYIRQKLEKLSKQENSFLFVTSYSEREGSFIASFSFILFHSFLTYGHLRHSLDFIRDDFEYFFRDIFPSNTKIDIKYSDHSKSIFDELFSDAIESGLRPRMQMIDREFRNLKLIVGLIGILTFGFIVYGVYKIEDKIPSSNIENTNINMPSLIRSEIDKMNAEKTNEEILKLLQQMKFDTTGRKKE